MIKSNLKLLITFFIIMLLSFTPLCLATDIVTPISQTIQDSNEQEDTTNNTRYADLYISDESKYDITNTIEGNVFASVDTLNIESKNNSSITGNVYATAKNVNIKSDIKYSETEKDEFGNSKIDSINSVSEICGNVFVTANKFVLEPSCKIDGDLYICANEVELAQNSVIYGNVFVVSNSFIINSQIGGDLYATTKNFDMEYYGFIRRDLHLNSDTANINGYVYRNSFISSNTIITDDEFINEQNLNIENASNIIFSGEVKGTANINSKSIQFKNKDSDNKNITCKILGDLNYSSNTELQIQDGIVSGNINYSKYTSNSKPLLSNIGEFILGLLTSLVYVLVVYFIIYKFMPNCKEKLSNLSMRDVIICLGIGLGILILVPIISILLFITRIGGLLGIILLMIYILFLILAKSIFVISIASLIRKNNQEESLFNSIIKLSVLTLILSLINLIPYFGFVISVLVNLIGLGLIIKSIK